MIDSKISDDNAYSRHQKRRQDQWLTMKQQNPSFEVHAEFCFDEEAFNEIRASLDGVKTTLCDYLSKEFGHVKKAPDDHPILKAIQSIEAIVSVFDTVEEVEEKEDEDEQDEELNNRS
jgi:hypothetical protein